MYWFTRTKYNAAHKRYSRFNLGVDSLQLLIERLSKRIMDNSIICYEIEYEKNSTGGYTKTIIKIISNDELKRLSLLI